MYLYENFCITNTLLLVVCVCLSRLEKANAQVITRSRTGNLPPQRIIDNGDTSTGTATPPTSRNITKATPDEIKEKMEQQLRIQRAAHQQKRALELKTSQGGVVKMVTNATQGKNTLINMPLIRIHHKANKLSKYLRLTVFFCLLNVSTIPKVVLGNCSN